jgi:cyclohexadienyl dehydratase
VLRVGTTGDYAPFSVVNADAELTGIDVEVARQLGRDLDRQPEFVQITWPELAQAVGNRQFDVAMSGITMRPDRALVGRFTRPYAAVGALALVRSQDTERFPTVDALDRPDVRIAVNAGGYLEQLARARFPRATIEPQANNRIVPERVREAEADAAISDSAEAQFWLGPDLHALGPFSTGYKAYLLPVGDDALAARIDEWLVARERDGWLDAQRLRWIGPDASLDATGAARAAVVAFIGLRLELAPSIGAAKRAADLPIADREQETRVLERVRDAAGANADWAVAVYRQVIDLSKAIQQTGTPGTVTAELLALRDALARIDAALVPALVQAPAADAATWSELLTPTLSLPGVSADGLSQLAAVLARAPQ